MLDEPLKEEIRQALARIGEAIPGFRSRRSQREMIAAIARAMTSGQEGEAPPVAVIEAPTGTGKTVAYLAAMLPIARRLEKQLVISTATVALQAQLAEKDLPLVRGATGGGFSIAVAKGRGRYACNAKLDRALSSGGTGELFGDGAPLFDAPPSATDITTLAAMHEAMAKGAWNGCRDTWATEIPGAIWEPLTNTAHGCSGKLCPAFRQCAFHRARQGLGDADVVVVNHDLLLADLALGGGILLPRPEDTFLVLDEAHHFHLKAREHFSQRMALAHNNTWVGDMTVAVRQATGALGQAGGQALAESADKLASTLEEALADLYTLLDANLDAFARSASRNRSEGLWRFPLGEVPEAIRLAGDNVGSSVRAWYKLLRRLRDAVHDSMDGGGRAKQDARADDSMDGGGRAKQDARADKSMDAGAEDAVGRDAVRAEQANALVSNLGGHTARVERIAGLWDLMLAPKPDGEPPVARWIALDRQGRHAVFDIEAAPTSAAVRLSAEVWPRYGGTILTSATLTALGRFDRLLEQSGLTGWESLTTDRLPSPFDYANHGQLSIPWMETDPKDAGAHTAEVTYMLPSLLDEHEGTLMLFASRRQMEAVAEGLPATLRAMLLVQGEVPKQVILETHRARIDAGGGSIIFGLASFAEGVDLAGRYCTHVVIAKLPFAPPDSPVEAAMSEWLEAQGRSPFMEMSVPDASLKLIQAAGRLLRSETDTGRVTLLDRRVLTKRYGRALLDALPAFERRIEWRA